MVLWLDVTSEPLTPLLTQHMEGLQSDHIVLDIVFKFWPDFTRCFSAKIFTNAISPPTG